MRYGCGCHAGSSWVGSVVCRDTQGHRCGSVLGLSAVQMQSFYCRQTVGRCGGHSETDAVQDGFVAETNGIQEQWALSHVAGADGCRTLWIDASSVPPQVHLCLFSPCVKVWQVWYCTNICAHNWDAITACAKGVCGTDARTACLMYRNLMYYLYRSDLLLQWDQSNAELVPQGDMYMHPRYPPRAKARDMQAHCRRVRGLGVRVIGCWVCVVYYCRNGVCGRRG